jgi:hypothetical protein
LTSKVFGDTISLSNERSITIMQTTNYKGFTVTLSDEDTKKLDKAWKDARKHWRCIVYDKANRKQMGFDVFGGSHATMKPLEALYLFVDDAFNYTYFSDTDELMHEYGYETYAEAKRVYKSLERAYFKARKFIGSDSDILEIVNELREEWG